MFRKSGRGDTARVGICYQQKSSCRFWSSIVFTPFTEIKSSEDTQRKILLIYIKIVCRTGNIVQESASKMKINKEPQPQKTSKKTVKFTVKYH